MRFVAEFDTDEDGVISCEEFIEVSATKWYAPSPPSTRSKG
jgi:hypothetical protein